MSDGSLPHIIKSIQSQLVSSKRELGVAQAKMTNRQREAKSQNLTLQQLRELGPDARVYRSVGRMCAFADQVHTR